jgi:hypothetical protein
MEIYTAEPLVPDPIPFARLKRYTSPDSNDIPAALIQEVEILLSDTINSLIYSGIRRNCQISARSVLLHQFTRKAIKLTVVIILRYLCHQSRKTSYD